MRASEEPAQPQQQTRVRRYAREQIDEDGLTLTPKSAVGTMAPSTHPALI